MTMPRGTRLLTCAAGLGVMLTCGAARATEYVPTSQTASSALPGWPASAVADGNPGSVWSSSTHAAADQTEWIAFWHDGFKDVNYVRMKPRSFGGALGFPRTFTIYWSDGSSWRAARTVTDMQTPYRDADIVLTLPQTVRCNGILISATVLGTDNVGNHVFQMAEFRAGHEAAFDAFSWVGNDGSKGRTTVNNVGAGTFDPDRPDKLRNWNYDARNPIIAPQSGTGLRNIYAPSVVRNGGAWNVYFGGWDNTTGGNDEVSVTVTSDDFATFGPHVRVVSHGAFTHVNNESVLRLAPGVWKMAYTTYAAGGYNRPGYASSTDGVRWTPDAGSTAALMTMSGYPGWATADVNGGNTLYHDGSRYHMYWIDFNAGLAMNHATSDDNVHYVSTGTKFSGYVPQSIVSFEVGGARRYLTAYHNNGPAAYFSLGASLASPPLPAVLFGRAGGADAHITSVGLVSDGTRLWGALYGASAVSSLDQNRIFATWLQRKAVFQSASTYLAASQAYGPSSLHVYMAAGQGTETGRFSIYDTDGTTLLRQTPEVTLLQGDVWRCNF